MVSSNWQDRILDISTGSLIMAGAWFLHMYIDPGALLR